MKISSEKVWPFYLGLNVLSMGCIVKVNVSRCWWFIYPHNMSKVAALKIGTFIRSHGKASNVPSLGMVFICTIFRLKCWPYFSHNKTCEILPTKWLYRCLPFEEHFVYAPSQWETLQCNVTSHWLGACTELSLRTASEDFPLIYFTVKLYGRHCNKFFLPRRKLYSCISQGSMS